MYTIDKKQGTFTTTYMVVRWDENGGRKVVFGPTTWEKARIKCDALNLSDRVARQEGKNA